MRDPLNNNTHRHIFCHLQKRQILLLITEFSLFSLVIVHGTFLLLCMHCWPLWPEGAANRQWELEHENMMHKILYICSILILFKYNTVECIFFPTKTHFYWGFCKALERIKVISIHFNGGRWIEIRVFWVGKLNLSDGPRSNCNHLKFFIYLYKPCFKVEFYHS